MRTVLAVLSIALSCSACSTTPVPTASAKSVPAKKFNMQQEGYATLIVKRDSGTMGGACKASVWIDGENVASLGTRDKVTLYLPPGEHIAGAKNGGICGGAVSETQIVLAAGQKRTYRIAILDAGGIVIQPTAF